MPSIEELAKIAAATEDQTETPAGGEFEYTPPKEGRTVARFVEYIEIGNQPQKPFEGKPKPDAAEVFLGFELLNPARDLREIEVEGGEKKLVADFIRIRLPKKLGEKARFKKLFNKMLYGRDGITHIAQMLGEAFLVGISHGKSADGKKTYVNLDKDGEWNVGAPRIEDPLEGTVKNLNVRENIRPLRIFLWNNATQDTWDSLYIDGTRKVKVEGVETEVSKNWLQELILSAKNYQGSPLEALLAGVSDLSLDTAPKLDEQPKTATEVATETVKAQQNAPAGNDDLAALGLT